MICIALFFVYQYQIRDDKGPKQDNEGYYLLSTKEDFRWFISTVRKGNTEINVRLMNDLILNDTADWENWENEAPENGYYPIVYYNGHFDGQGYALEGYYADTSSACFHFYRYALDSGDNLYGFSFRIHRQTDSLECAAFYRVKDGFLAEYIGVAPTTENENVLERVRYFAAAIDNEVSSLEVESEYDKFYGKEGWDFPFLHNPFAIALAYDRNADCSSYMLFTGAQ